MKKFEKTTPQPTLTEEPEEKMTEFEKDCEHFRNVFGPAGNRSPSQIYVMQWLRHSLAIDTPIILKGADSETIVGRSFLHDVGLEITRRADSEFQPKKRKPIEVDRSRGNQNR